MKLHVDVHLHADPGVEIALERLFTICKRIEHQGVRIMATLDQILESVAAESTKLDSVIALVDGLKQQLADALAGTTLPPAVQAKVDAIFAGAESNAGKIADALDENVPPVEP